MIVVKCRNIKQNGNINNREMCLKGTLKCHFLYHSHFLLFDAENAISKISGSQKILRSAIELYQSKLRNNGKLHQFYVK